MSEADDLDPGLLCIALSDSDGEEKTTQEARTGQSEDEFREVQRGYRVKVENGEIWKTVTFPLAPQVSKPEAQTLLHAVEELYFFRRFAEGARFARALVDDGGSGKLDEDAVRTLLYYERRCRERMESG
ncbi:hypothetical protein F4861DRAFT_545785 [Xylaria intraflava]|nr:hypothetical protein F4861DRAFT_545785 [Xylaria intraflava]